MLFIISKRFCGDKVLSNDDVSSLEVEEVEPLLVLGICSGRDIWNKIHRFFTDS
jgi:hypothetical protein